MKKDESKKRRPLNSLEEPESETQTEELPALFREALFHKHTHTNMGTIPETGSNS